MGGWHLIQTVGLALVWLIGSNGCSADDAVAPPEGTVPVGLEQVAFGLAFPLYVTSPPGDTSRLFVVEQGGGIRVVKNGSLLPTPFLNLSDRVSAIGEQGLLGLAFDPQYASTGRFLVHYTDIQGDTRVTSFHVSPDPDVADVASEQVVLTADQPFPNHNGGQILFGPDGFLYLGLGDGGAGGDPQGRGQDLSDLLGSILRVDVQSGSPYTVPQDNPFVGTPGAAPEVWSYGLRNPWRFSFDRSTGDLYIADVGQERWEEVDVVTSAEGAGKGINFGWNVMEGAHCYAHDPCAQFGLAIPVLEYSHSQGCSITGGYVYRGTAIPALQGHYFYADFCQGWVRSFRYSDGRPTEQADWPSLRPGGNVTSFGEDAKGELYVLSTNGGVYRIVPR
jgi:glucose/arabinose dehydrogenase